MPRLFNVRHSLCQDLKNDDRERRDSYHKRACVTSSTHDEIKTKLKQTMMMLWMCGPWCVTQAIDVCVDWSTMSTHDSADHDNR